MHISATEEFSKDKGWSGETVRKALLANYIVIESAVIDPETAL